MSPSIAVVCVARWTIAAFGSRHGAATFRRPRLQVAVGRALAPGEVMLIGVA